MAENTPLEYATTRDQIDELDKRIAQVLSESNPITDNESDTPFKLDYKTVETIVKGVTEVTSYELAIDMQTAGCFRAVAKMLRQYLDACDQAEATLAESKVKQNKLNEVQFELTKYTQNEWTREARKIDIERLTFQTQQLETEIRMTNRIADVKLNTAKLIERTLTPFKTFIVYDLASLIESRENEYWIEQVAVQIAIDTLTKQQLNPNTVDRLLKMPSQDYNAAIIKSMILIENATTSLNKAKWLKSVIHETGVISTSANTPQMPPVSSYDPVALSDNNKATIEALQSVSKVSGTVTVNMKEQ